MLEFGSAVVNLALDVEKAQGALVDVKKVGGMELAIEAAAVAGGFEMITKVVDASGRKEASKRVQRVEQGILFVMKHRMKIGMVVVPVIVSLVLSNFVKS